MKCVRGSAVNAIHGFMWIQHANIEVLSEMEDYCNLNKQSLNVCYIFFLFGGQICILSNVLVKILQFVIMDVIKSVFVEE